MVTSLTKGLMVSPASRALRAAAGNGQVFDADMAQSPCRATGH
jgi:hypothetical protein